LFYFASETISGVGGMCFEGDDFFEEKCTPEKIVATPLTPGDLA